MLADLFIPFNDYTQIGGVSSFMRNLKGFMDKNGLKYTNNIDNADTIFFPVAYDINKLTSVKASRDVTVIQRLDGVFYPSAHSTQQLEFGEIMKRIYLEIADFIVFQSEYSKEQCFYMFGEKAVEQYTIIVNGVDKKIFYPKPLSHRNDKLVFTTSGNFRESVMLEPVVKALDLLSKDISFELKVIGPVEKSLRKFLERKYINYLGTTTHTELAEQLCASDVFIYSFLNPACPNSVIEAVSTGIPVVGFNTGAMQELLFFNNELLAHVSDKIFQESHEFDPVKLKEKILYLIQNLEQIKLKAQKYSYLYDFNETGRKYCNVLVNKKL